MTSDEQHIKNYGQIFTPRYIVVEMLDYIGYTSPNILGKHIIDNSCGDGAFLIEIIDRYCRQYEIEHHTLNGVIQDLEKFIHGIEKDKETHSLCIKRMNSKLHDLGINGQCNWDIICADALKIERYDGRMDYVVGNPPYVRVHNLNNTYSDVKKYSFALDGMTDLYLVFFEIGFRMLNPTGKMVYISPSSWINSVAGKKMRNYIYRKKKMSALVDLEHFQAFENVITYTLISVFDNSCKHEYIEYYKFDSDIKKRVLISPVAYEESYIDGVFYFADRETLEYINIINHSDTPLRVRVKNGLATLQDKVFISDKFKFDKMKIPVIKGSTQKWREALFPYDKNGVPLGKDEIFSDKQVAKYLEENKSRLLKGRSEYEMPGWYLYGRSQAIKDVFKDKISINSIIKSPETIKLNFVPAGSGVYSGLYIVGDIGNLPINEIIKSERFMRYVSALRKDKSGGYYTYSSKELEKYLNYEIEKYERANS